MKAFLAMAFLCTTGVIGQPQGTVRWSMNSGNMNYDNHGGIVNCNQGQDISWSGNELTIHLNGGKPSNTCYARSSPINSLLGGRVPNRATISATIKVTNNGCNANTIWPAYWLVGTASGAWPGCGEIDIAERQSSRTETHLIGAGGSAGAFSPNNIITYNNFPNGLNPDGQYRRYAFEWNFRGQYVDFTAWMDGNAMGTHTCVNGGGGGQAETCRINYNAIKYGHHSIVFDADSHSGGSDRYSMSVKDVRIEEISAGSEGNSSVAVFI